MKLLWAGTFILVLLYFHGANTAPTTTPVTIDNRDDVSNAKEKRVLDPVVTGDFNICYDCDAPCTKALSNKHLNPLEFFGKVTSDLSALMDGQLRIVVGLNDYTALTADVNLAALVNTTTASVAIQAAEINDNYWANKFIDQMDGGCDSSFLITLDNWLTNHRISGMSKLHSMCTKGAHGIVKFSTVIDTMVRRLAHQIGRQIGMYGDNSPIPSVYLESSYDAYTADIKTYCPDAGTGIMKNPESAVTPYFSNCSKAYTNFWATYPKYYVHCLTEPSSGGRQRDSVQ